MSTTTYARAVDKALQPAGFVRTGRIEWRREVDGYIDSIDLQASRWTPERTVNVHIRDTATKELIEKITEGISGGLLYSVERRLGDLISGRDKWWNRDDPEGPQQVAAALQAYALPFLDTMHSSEAMITEKRGIIGDRWWGDTGTRLDLAVLLWRTGRGGEACELLQKPPKLIPDNLKAKVEAVRRFVCETPPPDPPET